MVWVGSKAGRPFFQFFVMVSGRECREMEACLQSFRGMHADCVFVSVEDLIRRLGGDVHALFPFAISPSSNEVVDMLQVCCSCSAVRAPVANLPRACSKMEGGDAWGKRSKEGRGREVALACKQGA